MKTIDVNHEIEMIYRYTVPSKSNSGGANVNEVVIDAKM